MGMTNIDHITLDVPDLTAATAFYAKAFGLDDRLRLRTGDAPTSGFRGFTLSLVVSQPSGVDSLVGSAVDAGAEVLKPVAKSFWGYGGVVRAPDGTIWKVATSARKSAGPTTREVERLALLLGVSDVKATKRFYVERGLGVSKSFGSKYVEFTAPEHGVVLALYGRKAAAKDAGVDPEGSGSHRLTIGGDAATFTDPDGFVWAPASDRSDLAS